MRNLKQWIALILAVVVCIGALAACTPKTPTPTTPDGTTSNTKPNPTDPPEINGYKEAPFITALGTYGKVEDRLPVADDIMVESGEGLAIGTYGGELKRTSLNAGNWTAGKLIEEGLFRFNNQGEVEPNVAKGYEVNEDATVYTIHLREGMKWSDGEPFTAEDCVWFYNAVCLNKVDGKGIRSCHKDANGDPATVEKVDDTTFTVTFKTPKYGFIEALTVDLKWHYAPKHIFETMVQYIIDGKNDEALAEGKKICGTEFADAAKMGKELLYYFWNYPNVPTLNPYVLSNEEGKNNIKGEYFEYVRNPYYWKVDAAGNQLPYIDKITYSQISNMDQELMLLLDGTVDFMTVSVADVPTIKQSETKININEWHGVDWGSANTQLHFNLNFDNAQKKELFNNIDFRHGMSICVNRDEFAAVLSNNWQGGGQAAPQEGALGYSEEWAKKWTEYDVAEAKALFEKAGLVMGKDGFYDFADGTDFELNIMSVADSGAAETYKVLEPYFRAAGIKCTFRDYDRSNVDNMMTSNEIECTLYPITPIGDISIILKPNSMVPGSATNVVWYGTMDESTATGDLLKLVQLRKKLETTASAEERTKIALEMLKLHEENMWTLNYMEAAPVYQAVNARIQNFPESCVWSDILRDMGIAHCQCWFIQE